jgi:hypothetical protein
MCELRGIYTAMGSLNFVLELLRSFYGDSVPIRAHLYSDSTTALGGLCAEACSKKSWPYLRLQRAARLLYHELKSLFHMQLWFVPGDLHPSDPFTKVLSLHKFDVSWQNIQHVCTYMCSTIC